MTSTTWAIVWGLLGVLRDSWQDILAGIAAVTLFPLLWILAAIL